MTTVLLADSAVIDFRNTLADLAAENSDAGDLDLLVDKALIVLNLRVEQT